MFDYYINGGMDLSDMYESDIDNEDITDRDEYIYNGVTPPDERDEWDDYWDAAARSVGAVPF